MHRHWNEASAVFVIGAEPRDLYYWTFGVRSEVLFGPADYDPDSVETLPGSGVIDVDYCGSAGPWQLDALVRFAAALPVEEARLHVFSNADRLPPALCLPAVTFNPALEGAAVMAQMRQCNAVLLPVSFEESQRASVRTEHRHEDE